MSLMRNHSRSRAVLSKLKPLLVGIVEVDKSPNVIAMAEVKFLFALFETLLRGGIVGSGAVQHHFAVGAFFSGGFFDVASDPIEHLAIDEGFFDDFNHLLVRHARGLEPHGVKAFPEIRVIIRMQFSGEVQTNLVHVARQMHPAIHALARTARVNNFTHARIIQ